jgi:6,7-dimethyl-8-ribityllumazine synthase
MSSALKNLSDFKHLNSIPDAGSMRFGIVVSEWNSNVTLALLKGAYATLLKNGASKKNIKLIKVPGSFELLLGAQKMALKDNIDAVVCIGCVIQGETRHFDFICQAVANGIADLNIKHNKPVVFGLLTTDTLEQAMDRCGGKYGNKGDEAAVTAIKMVSLCKTF